MSSSSSRPSKPKPSEVAAETKRQYIPHIRESCAEVWPTMSYLYECPLDDLPIVRKQMISSDTPQFDVRIGDPVDFALMWPKYLRENYGYEAQIPVICAANDKRPGGDWETASTGYEERLCRRSNLSATLATPAPGSAYSSHYPIPCEGAILSPSVVIFRRPHDRYEKLDVKEWRSLPVLSVPPTRWPKLNHLGTKYSFEEEREMAKNKIRAALRVCAYAGYKDVVIGDFGLGNGYRNPPVELAEMWRDVFLYDPDLRGQFRFVAFVFEDQGQSTARCILDDIAKKHKKSSSRARGSGSSFGGGSKGPSSKSSSGSGGASSSTAGAGSAAETPTDYEIFRAVFDNDEIRRFRSRPDQRCSVAAITSPE